ncbi:MAG: AMP-binding protein [Proteobacteria bacterium]|nr:AMP-binding protein [Pseudomonadota bacterium]
MDKSFTLIHFLESAKKSGKGITFIQEGGGETYLSYGDLFRQAKGLLTNLRDSGLCPGQSLILQIADNQNFLALFWACLLGKIIPVPLTLAQTDEYRLKLLKVWEVLQTPYIAFDEIVFDGFKTYLARQGRTELLAKVIENKIVPTTFIPISKAMPEPEILEMPEPDDTAYIQFSSGSTGDPRGIVLTHHNLVNNIGSFLLAKNVQPEDSYLSWLPLSHDLGLIGWHLNPMAARVDQYIMSPKTFVNDPCIWFDKACEHRVSILCSPNFGFNHFLKFFRGTHGKDWDLSCVRLMLTGAEHISHTLCHAFLDELAAFGLKKTALMAGYGLAEATLAVSVSPRGEAFSTHFLDVNSLGVGDRAKRVLPGDANCAAYVDEGPLLQGFKAKICDDGDQELPEGTIGHILLKSESVSSGYVNNPVATAGAFTRDGWLKTGDLGFVLNRRMVITGRSKEMIIVNGVNFYPHDIERVVGKVEAISNRPVVAWGEADKNGATEELIVFVSHKKALDAFVPVIQKIKEQVAREFNLPVSRVIPLESIPRTTSGKLQRVKLGLLYRQGSFDPIVHQVNRLCHARLKRLNIFEIVPEKRVRVLTDFICEQAGSLMGSDPIDPDLSLVGQGFDSLMGIELRNIIECALGIGLPISWLRKEESLWRFSARILETILEKENQGPGSEDIPGEKEIAAPSSLLEQIKYIDQMSEDQILEMIKALES